jgi:hypothetical protein
VGERESRVREGGGSRAGGSPLWCRTDRCQYRILKWISELGGACREPLSVWRRAWKPTLSPPAGYELRQWRTTPSVHNYAPCSSAHHQSTVYRDGRAHDVPQEAPGTTRAARARRGERRAGRRVASSTTAATYMLDGREWDAGASPAGCYASPTHRRAARAVDIACSTRCQELERLPWSSLRIGSACLRHVPGNAACRRFELPWGIPGAGSACRLRAPRSAPC